MRFRAALVGSAVAAVLAISGCDGEVIATPAFDGPWADAFGEAYQKSGSEYVRAILEDEVVTDQEYFETFARYRACDAALGIKVEDRNPGGGGSFSFPPQMGSAAAVEADDRCSAKTGDKWVSMLYWAPRGNPDNLDFTTLLIDCLIEAGILEPGYTRHDFERDRMSYPYPWLKSVEDRATYEQCNSDPLGLMGEH